MTRSSRTDDAGALVELEPSARAEVVLPADAHVIGEPVTVTQIRYSGGTRAGLLATCKRGDATYELSFADVVFPAASAGASVVARYRTWLGLAPFVVPAIDVARPHKVEGDDIVVGKPVDLLVLACKSNALRCRLLGSAREVTLRTAVRAEIAGSIITVTPKKQWTHARHPYLSGDVSGVRIDASVLGLVRLALQRADAPHDTAGRDVAGSGRPAYRLAPVAPVNDDPCAELLLDAQDCIAARDYAEAEELLQKVLALDLRHLDAHAMLGERNLSSWPTLALHHFELGVAIGSLAVGEDFDGVLPWGLVENRPFLRCLHGLSRALLRCDRREDATAALRRLLRLDPADPLGAGARLAAIHRENLARAGDDAVSGVSVLRVRRARSSLRGIGAEPGAKRFFDLFGLEFVELLIRQRVLDLQLALHVVDRGADLRQSQLVVLAQGAQRIGLDEICKRPVLAGELDDRWRASAALG